MLESACERRQFYDRGGRSATMYARLPNVVVRNGPAKTRCGLDLVVSGSGGFAAILGFVDFEVVEEGGRLQLQSAQDK